MNPQLNCENYSSQFPGAQSDILRLLTLSFVSLQDSLFIICNDEEKRQILIFKKLEPEFNNYFFMQKDWNNESIIKTIGNYSWQLIIFLSANWLIKYTLRFCSAVALIMGYILVFQVVTHRISW